MSEHFMEMNVPEQSETPESLRKGAEGIEDLVRAGKVPQKRLADLLLKAARTLRRRANQLEDELFEQATPDELRAEADKIEQEGSLPKVRKMLADSIRRKADEREKGLEHRRELRNVTTSEELARQMRESADDPEFADIADDFRAMADRLDANARRRAATKE